MSEREKKRKAIPVPGFLRKLSVDRRMQAVLLALLAAAGVLFYLHAYSMRYVSTLEYDSAAVTDQGIFTALQQDSAAEGDTVWLTAFSADEAVYRRGSSYYIGNSYVRIAGEMPLYVNGGDYLELLSSGGVMIMADWEQEIPAAGSYISNGTVTNFDGSETGDDAVLFLRLNNGLYMNTKQLLLRGESSEINMPMNSLLAVSEDGARYYARTGDEKLVYGTFTQTFGATVEMDGQSMTWQEFLYNLGILRDQTAQPGLGTRDEEEPKEPEPGVSAEASADASESAQQAEQSEQAEREDAQEGSSGGTGSGSGSSGETAQAQDGEGDDGSGSGQDASAGGASGGSAGGTGSESAGGSQSGSGDGAGSGSSSGSGSGGSSSGGSSDGSGSDGSGGSDSGSGGDGSGDSGSGTDSGSGSGSSGTGGTGGSGSGSGSGSSTGTGGSSGTGGSGNPTVIPWQKPTVGISGVDSIEDVYSMEAVLNVTDPAGSFNRVTLTFEWKEDGETAVRYRKTLREGGAFNADNLPPDTAITVKAYLQYNDADGKKQREESPFETKTFRTKPFSQAESLFLQFDEGETTDGNVYSERQITVYSLSLSGANGYLADKVNSGTLYIYKKGERDKPFAEMALSGSTLRSCKYGELDVQTLASQARLDPNSEYRYRIELYDRYLNGFAENGKLRWGYEEKTTSADWVKASGSGSAAAESPLYAPEEKEMWNAGGTLADKGYWGYTKTCKSEPTADITQITESDKENRLSQATLKIQISDPHEALHAVEGGAEGFGGEPPERGDAKLNVYYEVFCEDENPETPLMVSHVKEGDTVTVSLEGNGEKHDRNYIDTESLDADGLNYVLTGLTAGKTYTLRVYAQYNLADKSGVTPEAVQIGAMTFSSSTMASYGRMYYTFTSQHVNTEQPPVDSYDHSKYESATAQKLTMTVNRTRTNATLADKYFHHLTMSFRDRDTSTELFAMEFYRNDENTGVHDKALPSMSREITFYTETDETHTNREDFVYNANTFTWTLTGAEAGSETAAAADYVYSGFDESEKLHALPEITLTIQDVSDYAAKGILKPVQNGDDGQVIGYTFNQWEAFLSVYQEQTADDNGNVTSTTDAFMTSPAVLGINFSKDDMLKSFNAYTLATESYAAQGTVTDHTVTASSGSYRQINFTTLKEMPYVKVGGILQIGRNLYLKDLKIYDPDQALYSGDVEIRNLNTSSAGTDENVPFTYDQGLDNQGGWYYEGYSAAGLRLGTEYTLEILPADIRRTGRTSQPRYQYESLYFTKDDETGEFVRYTYTAGESVTGAIQLTGMSYPIAGEEDARLDMYNVYEVGNYEYGRLPDSGDPTQLTSASASYETMNPIAVMPGEVYYFHNMANGGTFRAVFLDSAQQVLGGGVWTLQDNGFVTVPEGAAYMQATMSGTISVGGKSYYSCTQAQVLKVYAEDDEFLEGRKIVSDAETPENGTFTFEGDALTGKTMIAVTAKSGQGGTASVTYTVTSADGTETAQTVSGTLGFTIDLTEKLSGATKVTVTGTDGMVQDVRLIDGSSLSALAEYNTDHLVAGYQALVEDKKGNLTGENAGLVRVTVRDSNGQEVENAGISGDGERVQADGSYSGGNNFKTTSGETYTVTLEVQWDGEYYVLDEQDFTASGIQYSIATEKQLAKTMTWPSASFTVTADLGEVSSQTMQVLNQRFAGTLDGQGHSMTVDATSARLYSTTAADSVIENFVLQVKTGNSEQATRYCYMIERNMGTIRNIVLTYDMGSRNVRHNYSAGLSYYNYGTIENFAIYFNSGSQQVGGYTSVGVGGATAYNSGTIRNGYVYSPLAIDVTTATYGGSKELSIGSVGGIAGQNYANGLIENVYAVFDMRVEQNANAPERDSYITNCGLIAGGNSGMIRNSFTNGEVTYAYWEETNPGTYGKKYASGNGNLAWPGSGVQGSARTQNDHYFSNNEYRYNDSYTRHQSSTSALRSASFYDETINSSGAFTVESQIENGYYPIVTMPECMEGTQSNIALNATAFGNAPSFIANTQSTLDDGTEIAFYEKETLSAEQAAQVKALMGEEQWKLFANDNADGTATVIRQFKVMDFTFSNRGGYLIDNLEIDGLYVKTLSTDSIDDTTSVRTVVTPYLENIYGELYLSTRADSYGDSFVMKAFSYGRSEQAMNRREGDVQLTMSFSYPLSYETWNTSTPRNGAINYRLIEDITFTSIEDDASRLAALEFFSGSGYIRQYSGSFDGNGYTLDFAGTTFNNPAYFAELASGGELQDLWVKNLTIRSLTSNSTYKGVIGTASSGSSIQGVHVTNLTIEDARSYAGGLVAYANQSTITDCTLSGVKIASGASANGLYAGGLIGYSRNTETRNCFVRGLDLDTRTGTSVKGTGGLAGQTSSSGWSVINSISSCYAQGTLRTSFANAGGVTGTGTGTIENVWTAVNIYGTKNVGALVGYAGDPSNDPIGNLFNGTVSTGEIYTDGSEISSRLVGFWVKKSSNISRNYAYSDQLLNSAVSTDVMDADGLADDALLKTYYFWQDVVSIGQNFCLYGDEEANISGIEDEVLPALYASDGVTILPQQEAGIRYRVDAPEFELVSATAVEQEITQENPYGAYELLLTFRTEAGEETTQEALVESLKTAVAADGLDLTAAGSQWTAEQDEDGKWLVTVTGIVAERRMDSYRLDYTFDGEGNSTGTKVTFKNDAGEDVYLYWMVDTGAKWTALMPDHGYQYENFKICDDIDLSGASIAANLKLNRLVGEKKGEWSEENYVNKSQNWAATPEFYRIENVSASVMNPWIYEITAELAYLEFADISLTTSSSFNNYGLVGSLVGEARYVDFHNISLRTGAQGTSYSYLGCIAYSSGAIENCRLADIQITGDGKSYGYVGGLTGYAQSADRLYAFGTADNSYRIDMGDSAGSSRGNYYGGLVGFSPVRVSEAKAEKIYVSGWSSVGGVAGYLYSGAESKNLELTGGTVLGINYIGGAVGNIFTGGLSEAVVRDSTVTAAADDAGGVIGRRSYGNAASLEAYYCVVKAQNRAGGLIGYAINGSSLQYGKAYGCTVEATASYAGGLIGHAGCQILKSAASEGTVTARTDAGGVVGQVANNRLADMGANNNLTYNAVSHMTVSATTNNAGGLVGSASGSNMSYNEVTDTVKVSASQAAGGIAGFLSGGTIHHNILAAEVTGTTRIGGMAGQVTGYGESFTAGGTLNNYVAQGYGNVIAGNGITGSGNYVAGLIGYFDPGSEPVDADGKVIVGSGYLAYMSSGYYYANVIVPQKIQGASDAYTSWYANYQRQNENYANILDRNGEKPQYDAVNLEFYVEGNNATNYMLDLPSASDRATLVAETVVKVNAAALKSAAFYTTANASGGMGFDARWINTDDVGKTPAYYPYIRSESEDVLTPYQTADGNDWNSYYGAGADTPTPFTGTGIQINLTGTATTALMALDSVADSMVYASGIDTINIDFSNIGAGLVTFEIPGYVEETSINTLESSAWVCSFTYDFDTDFEVVLYSADHSVEESHTYTADQLRSTVMAWGDGQYYLRADGVYRIVEDGAGGTSDAGGVGVAGGSDAGEAGLSGSADAAGSDGASDAGEPDSGGAGSSVRVLEGSFVHLYNGEALADDGTVHSLTGTDAGN